MKTNLKQLITINLLGFCFLISIFGAGIWYQTTIIRESTEKMDVVILSSSSHLNTMIQNVYKYRMDLLVYIATSDFRLQESLNKRMETALNEANTALEALTKSPVNASSKKAIEVFKVAYSKWYNVGQGILSLKNQGDNEGALNMQQTQCEPAFAQVKASFVSLEEIIVEEQLRQAEIINLSTLTTQRISSFGVFLLVIGGISVLIFLIRFSNRTMNSITAKLDLTSSNLVSSSNQVKSASESLADNTNQQAASLEETSASLQELESTVKETSNYAME